jgi:hypothetical protein
MGHFSVEKPVAPGSVLSGNQQFGVGCVSDRPFDVRGADGRLVKHGCALFCRTTDELKAVCRHAGMRARPAAALRKRHAAVAANGFRVIGLVPLGSPADPRFDDLQSNPAGIRHILRRLITTPVSFVHLPVTHSPVKLPLLRAQAKLRWCEKSECPRKLWLKDAHPEDFLFTFPLNFDASN